MRTRAALLIALLALTACSAGPSTQDSWPGPGGGFRMRVVTTGLVNPFELTMGPDGFLWLTEKPTGRVLRISPADGASTVALTVPDLVATRGAQDGLLGLALHPRLLTGEPYVYLASTAEAGARIVRYTFADGRLVEPVELLTGMPRSLDHDSGRLVYGPDDRLYYTIGDQGNNQYDRVCLTIQAQTLPTAEQVATEDRTAYQGKVLRLNLDGSVPDDNPMLAGVRSHVFSSGHRNAQGLVFGEGRLYSSEQGPKTDDEINMIVPGGNYGWPLVAGHRDDKSYVYGDWSASSDPPCDALRFNDLAIPPSVPQRRESQFDDPAFVPPLRTFHTVDNGHDFAPAACGRNPFLCWPTVAPSGLDWYPVGGAVPGWGPSLLMPSLKDGAVYRLPVGSDGTTLGEPEVLWRTANRYRDVAIAPDTRTFYVVTDTSGLARGADGRPLTALANPGAILEFTWVGESP